jgi:hypothetical protein
MKHFPARALALLLIGPGGISAEAQDAPPTFLLDPADIGVGWQLIDQHVAPATAD